MSRKERRAAVAQGEVEHSTDANGHKVESKEFPCGFCHGICRAERTAAIGEVTVAHSLPACPAYALMTEQKITVSDFIRAHLEKRNEETS